MKLKRIAFSLLALLLLAAPFSGALQATVQADDTNLLANSSVEVVGSDGNPTSWTADSWGTSDTKLSSTTDAYDGTRAVTITSTSRTSGDAKWTPDAVTVTAGKAYDYSDYFKASVPTEIDAVFYDASGNASYTYLTGLSASNTWQQATASFTAPDTAVRVSILHILATAGTLTTDDFSLTLKAAPIVLPPPTSGNLIANASMETASGNSPANWNSDHWGTNDVAFSYDTTGHTGSHSASVTVKSYTDGDAKWYANPVSVSAGKTYTYSDYYKSGVSTRVVVAYQDASGAYTYLDLPSVPSSTDWKQYQADFTVPANMTSVTVYHLIDQVGTLTLDDVSLSLKDDTPPPPATGTIANASVESSSNGTTPDGWQSSAWGTNDASFGYASDAHSGNHSIKTAITTYTDGDAKWYFDPLAALQAGKVYSFSAWVKSSTQAHAVAAFQMQDGTTQYATLSALQSPNATAWQQYTTKFSVPVGATSTTVYMLISSVGWVETDDYSLNLYVPTPFKEGLVSLTFDDGWTSTYQNGLPLLKKYNLKSTQYIISGYIGAPMYMNKTQIRQFKRQGSEIGSHTVSHPDLTTLSATDLTHELKDSQATLQSIFGKGEATSVASPYGTYNDNVIANMKLYYKAHRSTDAGFNSRDTFNPYNVVVQNVDYDTPNAQVEAWVAQAKADKTWLVLVYHQVEDTMTPGDIYAVKTSNLDAQLQYIKNSGVTVKTFGQALAEVTAQL